MSEWDIQYVIGAADFELPVFNADAVMIRGYGYQALSSYPYAVAGVPINCASAFANPVYGFANVISDLAYLEQNDLKRVGVKKVVLAVEWCQTQSFPILTPTRLPAEMNLAGMPPWVVGGLSAITLAAQSQIFPTIGDDSLIQGMQFLQSKGYSVGVCPLASVADDTLVLKLARSHIFWLDQAAFTSFLGSYSRFIQHYVDLCVAHQITPWIFYLGYGLWDLTFHTSDAFFQQWIALLRSLAAYVKFRFPSTTLVTYAADLDEYFSEYQAQAGSFFELFRLDALWSSPDIDVIGINWFAPLSTSYTNDPIALGKGVLRQEDFSYILDGYDPRSNSINRTLSHSHEAGTTGFNHLPILDVRGIKNILGFLTMGHYAPPATSVVSSPSPLAGNTLNSTLNSSPMIGDGTVVSIEGVYSAKEKAVGGLAPLPPLNDTYLSLTSKQSVFFSLPDFSEPPQSFDFVFDYSSSSSSPGILCDFFYGLRLYYDNDNLTISIPTTTDPVVVEITSALSGRFRLYITATLAEIWFDDGIVAKVAGNYIFPSSQEAVLVGADTWAGQVFHIIVDAFVGADHCGGIYYFEEAYAGIRTSWVPESKSFLATSVGYPSLSYGCVEPGSLVQLIMGTVQGTFPPWFTDAAIYTNVPFLHHTFLVSDIEGPYGSTFIMDEAHQGNCLAVVCEQLKASGSRGSVAYYFDTRSRGGMLYQVNGKYVFNDCLAFRYSQSLNGKAAVTYSGSDTSDLLHLPTVSQLLGLSQIPAPEKLPLVIHAKY